MVKNHGAIWWLILEAVWYIGGAIVGATVFYGRGQVAFFVAFSIALGIKLAWAHYRLDTAE